MNLATQQPAVLATMQARLAALNATTAPCMLCGAKADPAAQPEDIPGLEVCTEGVCRKMGVWQPWVTEDQLVTGAVINNQRALSS